MPKIELTTGEIHSYSTDIYDILINIPLHHLNEIMELAYEGRVKEGEIDDLDIESEEESDQEEKFSDSEENSSEEENDE